MFRPVRDTRALRRRIRVASCMTLLWSALAAAATPLTDVSLGQAVQLAVQRAPALLDRHARISSAGQEVARAGALPDPMLTVGIDNLPVTGADAFDTRADFMTMKKSGLRQEISARAQREARRWFAARGVEEARAQEQAERLSVQRATDEAWVDLWAARRELESLQLLHEDTGLAAQLAKARVARASDPVTNALATAAAVIELDNRIDSAQAAHVAAQAGLARRLGDASVTLGEPQDFTALPISESELLAQIDRMGELLPAAADIETAAATVDLARADKRPDWSVAKSYGQREGGRSDMVMVEVGIGLPLFTRNHQDRGIAAREADYQATLATREDLRRQQAARIRSDYARWQGLQRQVERDRSALLPLTRDRSTTALAACRAGA